MNMIRVLSLTLALVCSPYLTSCSNDTKQRQEQSDIPIIEELVQAVQTVEQNLSQGLLLKNATANDRTELRQNIYNLKIATYRLRANAYDNDALSQLYQAFEVYAKLNLQEADRARLDDLNQKLRETLDIVASMQGKTLAGIERSLFTKIFNYELAPFQATAVWKIEGNKDKQYAMGNGKDDAWLISPRMDLSEVGNPSFVVDQAINDKGQPFLEGVTYLVSQDYVAGNPDSANWETIRIESMPDGSSFNFRKSEAVSLKAYAGKKIVVAFKIDGKKLVFMSGTAKNVAWEIASFTLLGTGKLNLGDLNITAGMGTEVVGPAKDLAMPYVKNFEQNGLTNFATAADQKLGWSMFKFTTKTGTENCCVKIGGKDTTAWLISPRYDFANVKNPGFQLRHAINKRPKDGVIGIYITTDESVADLATVKWEKVPAAMGFSYDEDGYIFNNTEKFDLSAYAGKKVVIAFKYEQGPEGIFPVWEIKQLIILGEGTLSFEPVKVNALPLKQGSIVVPTPIDPGSKVYPFKRDFSAEGIQGWTLETKAPSDNKPWVEFKDAGIVTSVAVTNGPANSWLMSPAIDLGSIKNPVFRYSSAFGKDRPMPQNSKFEVRIKTDEAESEWKTLIAISKVQDPEFKFSQDFSLQEYAGKKIVIGFFVELPVGKSPFWKIQQVIIDGDTAPIEAVPVAPIAVSPQPTSAN